MSTEIAHTKPPLPFWKIWANPIFRRYCRSRLRPKGLGFLMMITLIIAGFIFFITRAITLHRMGMDPIDAERSPIIPLLVLQGIVLFLLGTGQVAGGMTAESDEGVIDYQRLAPMSPLAKVVGFLFGLPIREYVVFFATLPFTIWAMWKGEVLLSVGLSLYAIFLSSAILYHMTGLVAGTVVKNKRWAFLVSMGVVFLLYTVIPQISNFGLVHFRYLTVQPVFEEILGYIIPREEGAAFLAMRAFLADLRPFGINLPEVAFTLVTQGVLILTLGVMVWRRWRRHESHLLGKVWATGLFATIQVSLLGSTLPLINGGFVFPSQEFRRRFRNFLPDESWRPDPGEAFAMVAVVGAISLLMLWLFTSLITPSTETQLRGWRRIFKVGKKRLRFGSDPSTSFWWVAVMALSGAVGWFVFTRAVVESRWFPGAEVPLSLLGIYGLVFLAAGLGFHALLEGRGGKFTVLAAIFIGLVPILVALVLGTISEALLTPALWIGGISPLSWPLYAGIFAIDVPDIPVGVLRAAPLAFWFWQGVAVLACSYYVGHLVVARRAVAERARKSM